MVCTKETVKSLGLNLWVDSGSEEVEAQVDIVLVQGLNAHPYYTWTGGQRSAVPTAATASLPRKWTKKLPFSRSRGSGQTTVTSEPAQPQPELFWPRDLLHPSLPPCTISTYSYPSDWTSRDSRIDLRKCGEQFLNVVYQDRLQKGAPRRPLVLVGHSLGGLVIQQALVVAKHNDVYRDVRESAGGAIFLGSPMQGCDAANFAAWVQQAVGNNQPLLRSLTTGSNDLLLLLRDFWDGYSHLSVVCFYEDQKSTYGVGFKTTTVHTQSATSIGGRRLYLAIDHSGLNKFTGPDDVNFQLFLPALQEVVKAAMIRLVHSPITTAIKPQEEKEPAVSTEHSHWLVPFVRDRDFVDRADLMERIKVLLSDPSDCPRVALSGLGGVGKSQIAIEYAYRKREQSPGLSIFWVHANNPARFRASYQAIANEVQITGHDDPETNHLDLVYRWLLSRRSGEWLLIIDNADNIDFIRASHDHTRDGMYDFAMVQYLPQRAGGSMLFTSRDRQAAFAVASRSEFAIPISPMTELEARQLIDKKIPDHFGDAVQRYSLACQLELIPLAITQAAAYIVRSRRMSIDRYLRLFHGDAARVLTEEGADIRRDPEVPNSVVRTWELSFEQIGSRNPLAIALLSCIALIDRQGIPDFLLRQDYSDFEFEEAIEVLLGFTFVTSEEDETMFSMHRLVHLAIREWLKSTGELQRQQEVVLRMLDRVYPRADFEAWTTCRILEPHAMYIRQDHYESDELDLISASLLLKRSGYLGSQGEYLLAEQLSRASTRAREHLLGPEHLATLASMTSTANTLFYQSKYKEAEDIQRRVLAVRKRVLGREHPDTLISMNNVANILNDQGKCEEAEEINRRVLAASEKVLGPEHPNTLTSIHNLALVLGDQGKHEEAEEIHRQVLAVREKIQGHEHFDTLISMNNLASILRDQGKHEEAQEMNQRVLVAHEKLLGCEHPVTLNSMNNLAIALSDQGKHEKALEIHRQVLAVREKILGHEHPSTLMSVWSLAFDLASTEAYDEAYALYRHALAGLQKSLGQDHPQTQKCREQFEKTFEHRVKETS